MTCIRALVRLLPTRDPRQKDLRASSWLAPSLSPTDLATSRWRRRSMRPTDICHSIELRVPAPRAFPASLHTFMWWALVETKALREWLLGDRTFHDVRWTASADRHSNTLSTRALYCVEREHGRFLPMVLMRSSLWHPCRNPLWFILRLIHFRDCCVFTGRPLSPYVGPNGLTRVGECGDHQDHSYRRLVKADASLWSGMPSINGGSS